MVRHAALPYRSVYDTTRHAPLYCGFNVTLRCNLKCPWCVHPALPSGESISNFDATPEITEKILRHPLMKSVIHVNLTGGEPFLNPHLFRVSRLIHEYRHLVGIVTNGLLLQDRMDELVASGIKDIRVSVYRNTLDRLAGILPALRGKVGLSSSYIIMRSELINNPEAIESVVRMCRDSGCVATRLNFCMPVGAYGAEELVYDDDPELLDLKRRLSDRFPGYALYWRRPVKRPGFSPVEKTCRQLWETFHVDASGNLGLCCKLCTTLDKKGGNLFEDKLGNLLNSPFVRNMRTLLLQPGPAIPKDCANCLYLSDRRAVAKWMKSPAPHLFINNLFHHAPQAG